MSSKPERPRFNTGAGAPPPELSDEARRAFLGQAKVKTAQEPPETPPAVEPAPAPATKPKTAAPKKPPAKAGALPWDHLDERPNWPRWIQLQPSEALGLKLQWLKDNDHIKSFTDFAREAVEAAVAARLKDLGVK